MERSETYRTYLFDIVSHHFEMMGYFRIIMDCLTESAGHEDLPTAIEAVYDHLLTAGKAEVYEAFDYVDKEIGQIFLTRDTKANAFCGLEFIQKPEIAA